MLHLSIFLEAEFDVFEPGRLFTVKLESLGEKSLKLNRKT